MSDNVSDELSTGSTDTAAVAEMAAALMLKAQQPVIAQMIKVMGEELAAQNLSEAGQGMLTPLTNLEVRKDPFDGTETLYGEWRDAHGQMAGNLQIRPGGTVFAEFDIIQPHPTKPKWFIEAIEAWGEANQLKTELRLIPALGD